MADRLYIDRYVVEKIIPKIDASHLLELDKTNAERMKLFLFAMALGIRDGKRTPLKSKEGFILESSIDSVDRANSLLFSLLVDELRRINQEDKIDDTDMAYKIAEEYANTGFKIIEKWKYDSEDEIEDLKYELIGEMDEKFEQIQQK